MARYTGATKKIMKRFNLLPEVQVVESRRGRGSDQRQKRKTEYGIRLEEKQKLRFIYGVQEKQFRRYFEQAQKTAENTGNVLLISLEARLDNVIYRLGLAPNRASARQLVNHGHVLVNGKKIDIPSYQVQVDDQITLKEKAQNLPHVVQSIEQNKAEHLPSWLKREGTVGKVVSLPSDDELRQDIDVQLIIEYYSR